MKSVAASLLLLITFCAGYSQDDPRTVPLETQFTLKPGQQIAVEGTGLKVTFTRVIEDSRCPRDVVCAWAGNAEVNLELRKKPKKKIISVVVNTTSPPREAEFKGFTVKLVRLTPERTAAAPTDPASYEVTLIVTRAED